jgi:hypothetical protein
MNVCQFFIARDLVVRASLDQLEERVMWPSQRGPVLPDRRPLRLAGPRATIARLAARVLARPGHGAAGYGRPGD